MMTFFIIDLEFFYNILLRVVRSIFLFFVLGKESSLSSLSSLNLIDINCKSDKHPEDVSERLRTPWNVGILTTTTTS